jgi:hypothetical protein
LVDVETGQILAIKDSYNTWMTSQDEEYLLDALAQKFLEEFPILQGMIIYKDKDLVDLSLGAKDQIKQGMKVLIYREKETKKNQNIICEARIAEVKEDFSRISPKNRYLIKNICIGDNAITK